MTNRKTRVLAAPAALALGLAALSLGTPGDGAIAADSTAPAWTIQPGGTLGFTAMNNGSERLAGEFGEWNGDIRFDPRQIPKNDRAPLIDRARQQEPDFNAILVWSRFPHWRIDADADAARVFLNDLRFPERQRGFGAATTIHTDPH